MTAMIKGALLISMSFFCCVRDLPAYAGAVVLFGRGAHFYTCHAQYLSA